MQPTPSPLRASRSTPPDRLMHGVRPTVNVMEPLRLGCFSFRGEDVLLLSAVGQSGLRLAEELERKCENGDSFTIAVHERALVSTKRPAKLWVSSEKPENLSVGEYWWQCETHNAKSLRRVAAKESEHYFDIQDNSIIFMVSCHKYYGEEWWSKWA